MRWKNAEEQIAERDEEKTHSLARTNSAIFVPVLLLQLFALVSSLRFRGLKSLTFDELQKKKLTWSKEFVCS